MGFSGDVPRDTTSEVPIGYKNCTFHRIIKVAMAFLPAKNGGISMVSPLNMHQVW